MEGSVYASATASKSWRWGIAFIAVAAGMILGHYGHTAPGLIFVTVGALAVAIFVLLEYRKNQSVIIAVAVTVAVFLIVWVPAMYFSMRDLLFEITYWAAVIIALAAVLAFAAYAISRSSKKKEYAE